MRPLTTEQACKAKKSQLEQILADDRVRKYPSLYAGHYDDALFFVRREYPTRKDLLRGLLVFGLVMAPNGGVADPFWNDCEKKKIVGYLVYANGIFEGDAKTLAGARRMAEKVERVGMRANVKASMVEGKRSWNEPVVLSTRVKKKNDAQLVREVEASLGRRS